MPIRAQRGAGRASAAAAAQLSDDAGGFAADLRRRAAADVAGDATAHHAGVVWRAFAGGHQRLSGLAAAAARWQNCPPRRPAAHRLHGSHGADLGQLGATGLAAQQQHQRGDLLRWRFKRGVLRRAGAGRADVPRLPHLPQLHRRRRAGGAAADTGASRPGRHGDGDGLLRPDLSARLQPVASRTPQHLAEVRQPTAGGRAARPNLPSPTSTRKSRAGQPRQVTLSGRCQPRFAPAAARHWLVFRSTATQPLERAPSAGARPCAQGLGGGGRNAQYAAGLFAPRGRRGQGTARSVCRAAPAASAGARVWRRSR